MAKKQKFYEVSPNGKHFIISPNGIIVIQASVTVQVMLGKVRGDEKKSGGKDVCVFLFFFWGGGGV